MIYLKEIETQYLKTISFLEEQKDMISPDRFKELIMENWRDFCTSIQDLKQKHSISETEFADLNLSYDKLFGDYYEKILREEAKYMMLEAQR